MKSLGGVGAVVLGGMLLLTIKVGPIESPQAPPPVGPTDAVAAPALAPASNQTLLRGAPEPAAFWVVSEGDGKQTVETSILLVRPPTAPSQEAKKAKKALRCDGEAQVGAWAWAMSLPAGIFRL